jgi:hypothetical protein
MELFVMKHQHSPAWVFQAWASFVLSISVLALGIVYMPVDPWKKAFLGMGVLFSITSTFSVAKTTRDLHEAKRMITRIDEARVEKLIGEHDTSSSML